MKFTSVSISVPVDIDGVMYTLKQANTDAVIEHRNRGMNAMSVVDGKAVGLSNPIDTEPVFLAKCLFDNSTGRPVTVGWLRSLDYRIFSSLFKKLREISGMDEVDVGKNSASATAE
jgi:hypothetical protein